MKKIIAVVFTLAISAVADDCFQEPKPSKSGVGTKAVWYPDGFYWVQSPHTGLVAWQGTTPRDIVVQLVGTMKDDPATPTINEAGQPYLLASGTTLNSLGVASSESFQRCGPNYGDKDWRTFSKVELILLTFAPGTKITSSTKPLEWARVTMLR